MKPLLALGVASMLASACVATQPAPRTALPPELSPSPRIAAGARVLVSAESEVGGCYRIDPDGALRLPGCDVPAIGKSETELEHQVARCFERAGQPVPRIEVFDFGLRATVAGHVAKPGTVYFARALTLTQAILRSGWLSADADGKIMLTRGKDRRAINLSAILEGRARDVALVDGDLIFVPESACEGCGTPLPEGDVVSPPRESPVRAACPKPKRAASDDETRVVIALDPEKPTIDSIQAGLAEANREKIVLDSHGYGPRHPRVEAQTRVIRAFEDWMRRQAEVDLRYPKSDARSFIDAAIVTRDRVVPDHAPLALRRLAFDLGMARIERERLLSSHGENHPNRIAASARIADLERRFDAELAAAKSR
jgi:hypothetical protein